MRKILLLLTTLSTLTGCSDWVSGGITTAAVAGATYWLIDPREPNWNVEMSQVGQSEYQIELRMKTFVTGGQGEAVSIFHAAAEEMVRRERSLGYEILSYQEGMQSEFLGGRRYALGVIRLHRIAEPEQMWLDRP